MSPPRLTAAPDLVIFDCDGVLVDSEGPMHEVLCADLQAHGLTLTIEECLSLFMGKSIEGVVETALSLGADLPDGWKTTLYDKVHARLKAGVELIPGVDTFIQSLKQRRIPFCVASNGSEAKMKLMLSQHRLWQEFEPVCFSAQSIGIAKPDPGFLRHVLKAMGDAKNPVVIEDSPVGVQSASAAGLPCVILASGTNSADRLEHGTMSFARMDSLADYILSFCDESA